MSHNQQNETGPRIVTGNNLFWFIAGCKLRFVGKEAENFLNLTAKSGVHRRSHHLQFQAPLAELSPHSWRHVLVGGL